MRFAGPPPGVPPAVLFRSLLPLRPECVLSTQLSDRLGSEGLRCVAMLAREEQAAIDEAASAPLEIQESRLRSSLVSRAVWTPSGRLFASAEEVGELYEDEIEELATEVIGALNRICPTYAQSDWQAWKRELEIGARHQSNFHESLAIAQACDPVTFSDKVLARPDRYWGVSFSELLDGHWMIWRASRAAHT